MPTPIQEPSPFTPPDTGLQTLGIPTPPPPPPTARPTLSGSPIVSSTPGPGQTVALDAGGRLAVATSRVNVFTADPVNPPIGSVWYRQDTKQLSIRHDGATTVRVTLA